MILGGGVAVCLFTFVGASRGHLCDSTAFLCTCVSVQASSGYVDQQQYPAQPSPYGWCRPGTYYGHGQPMSGGYGGPVAQSGYYVPRGYAAAPGRYVVNEPRLIGQPGAQPPPPPFAQPFNNVTDHRSVAAVSITRHSDIRKFSARHGRRQYSGMRGQQGGRGQGTRGNSNKTIVDNRLYRHDEYLLEDRRSNRGHSRYAQKIWRRLAMWFLRYASKHTKRETHAVGNVQLSLYAVFCMSYEMRIKVK